MKRKVPLERGCGWCLGRFGLLARVEIIIRGLQSALDRPLRSSLGIWSRIWRRHGPGHASSRCGRGWCGPGRGHRRRGRGHGQSEADDSSSMPRLRSRSRRVWHRPRRGRVGGSGRGLCAGPGRGQHRQRGRERRHSWWEGEGASCSVPRLRPPSRRVEHRLRRSRVGEDWVSRGGGKGKCASCRRCVCGHGEYERRRRGRWCRSFPSEASMKESGDEGGSDYERGAAASPQGKE